MPRYADGKLRKVTLNLYDQDVEYIKKTFQGQDYTAIIREWIKISCKQWREEREENEDV